MFHSKLLFTQKMQMQVHHLLPAILPHMKRKLIAGDPLLLRELLGLEDEHPRNVRRLLGDFRDGCDEVLRNEEEVGRRLRVNILEREDIVILIDNRGGNLAPENAMEDRIVGHGTGGNRLQHTKKSIQRLQETAPSPTTVHSMHPDLPHPLRIFFRTVDRPGPSSFDGLSEEDLEAHMGIDLYGKFRLTGAVRPSYDLRVVPEEGYRFDTYQDGRNHITIPVIMAAVTRRKLFEVFMRCIEPLGHVVDAVLEASHDRPMGHQDGYREHIDSPVLLSLLTEFENLLTNDGCTGIAILNPALPAEVQLDDHKLLITYAHTDTLAAFREVLDAQGIPHKPQMKFITEADHIHRSSDEFRKQAAELLVRLGVEEWEE